MILADGLILATDGNKTLYLIQPDPPDSSLWLLLRSLKWVKTGVR